jgi:hypothetical protein
VVNQIVDQQYARYFYKCNHCANTDAGHTFLDFEIVECPSCGTRNMTRWEAKPNLSREWAYCEAFGHQWVTPPGKPIGIESCDHCSSSRDFTKAVGN